MSSDARPDGGDVDLPPAVGSGAPGIFFIICAPSGGGKGTLIRRVLKSVPGLAYSVSWTTRPPRPDETDGVSYYFTTEQDFEQRRDRGEFLEWAMVHGNLYGTSRAVVEKELAAGRDIVLEIDVQGAAAVRQLMQEAVGVMILPPSFEALRDRLLARRTDAPETLALRLSNARGEVARYTEFDYVVLNDEVDRAAQQLAAIVYAERARRTRQEWLARRVLATFPEAPPYV